MRLLIRALRFMQRIALASAEFLLLSVAHFTRPVTPTGDRMDERKRGMIRF
jgi:hypothetical protein